MHSNDENCEAQDIQDGTEVHQNIENNLSSHLEIKCHTPHANDVTFEKYNGYRTSNCDAVTVSSKKVSSSSPEYKRSPNEQSPLPVTLARNPLKSGISQHDHIYSHSENSKKSKTKNCSKSKKRNYQSIAKVCPPSLYKTGRWTRLEHFKFLEALKIYGKEWSKVQEHVYTRTSTQARSHAQKFFAKLEKKQLTLDEFLERLDINQLKVDLRLGETGDSTEYDEDQPLITIANQKNKSSVLNIAMSDSQVKEATKPHYQICNKSECHKHVNSEYNEEYADHESSNNIALDDINNECESKENVEQSYDTSNLRLMKQRKAKLNHTILSK